MVEDLPARSGAPSTDPMVGKTLSGRFKILEKLGAGGMGTVYKAIQSPLDRLVALKVLNPNYDSKRDPGFQRRFFLEASVTSKLKHPNTITVIDYGKTDDGIYYLAMEYVEGVTLAQVLTTEGPIPWNRVLNIAQQICRSLREAHRAGMIHRDLKPANIMVCNEETDHDLVKVLDFGLVKSFQPEGANTLESNELTQAGVFLGSPQYMAPEQARNLADPRSDVYSLGVVLFQMLTGKPPFVAEQSIDVIVKHMKEAPPHLRDIRPDLVFPAEVEALVAKCLEKNPDARFQTMDEFLEAIRAAALGTGQSGVFNSAGHPSHSSTPPPMPTHGLPGSGAHRSPSQSGAIKASSSGLHKSLTGSPSGVNRTPASGAHSRPVPTVALDITVDSGARVAPPGLFSTHAKPSQGKRLVPLWIFLGSALIGLAVVAVWVRGQEPLKAPPVIETPAKVAPVPAEAKAVDPVAPVKPTGPVKFRVLSDPMGAKVMVGDRAMGETPLEFDRPANADGTVTEDVSFSLDGYQRLTVTATGSWPEVVVNQKLKKKISPASGSKSKKPRSNSPGYKEDPYQ